MLYPHEVIEEVRSLNDIVDVVASYVSLKQKGNNYFGLCPFHNEKTPSFSVSSDRQIYHCFGCGETGNVISFVMKLENCDFKEAISFLADKIGYQLPAVSLSESYKEKAAKRAEYLEINRLAARFFFDNLMSENGAPAEKYLAERGVSSKAVIKYGLGYASGDKSGSLTAFLTSKGYSGDTLDLLGLSVKRKSDGAYTDRFFSRLMFPIFNPAGEIVGFGGRVLYSGEPKYLNSKDTPLFDKSSNLYSINFARKSRARQFILVEGYMDVISLYQAGIQNAVAALGTAFNPAHARLLKKYCDSVVIAFDGDSAGINAALRAIPILTASGLKISVLKLDNAKDPDEYIKNFGPERFNEKVAESVSSVTFQIDCLQKKYNIQKTGEKIQFLGDVAKVLATLNSAIERDAHINEAAALTKISPDSIKAEISKLESLEAGGLVLGTPYVKSYNHGFKENRHEKGILEAKKRILYILVNSDSVYEAVKNHLLPGDMDDVVYTRLLEIIYSFKERGKPIFPAEIAAYFETSDEQKQVLEAFVTAKDYTAVSLEKDVNDLIRKIKLDKLAKDFITAHEAETLNALGIKRRNINELYINIPVG